MLSPEGYVKEHNCLFLGESPKRCPYQVRKVLFDISYVKYKIKKNLEPLLRYQDYVKRKHGIDSHTLTSETVQSVLSELKGSWDDSQTTQG